MRVSDISVACVPAKVCRAWLFGIGLDPDPDPDLVFGAIVCRQTLKILIESKRRKWKGNESLPLLYTVGIRIYTQSQLSKYHMAGGEGTRRQVSSAFQNWLRVVA